eukprot:6208348-Pleurochrysis_carterae.AAC.1
MKSSHVVATRSHQIEHRTQRKKVPRTDRSAVMRKCRLVYAGESETSHACEPHLRRLRRLRCRPILENRVEEALAEVEPHLRFGGRCARVLRERRSERTERSGERVAAIQGGDGTAWRLGSNTRLMTQIRNEARRGRGGTHGTMLPIASACG